MKKLLVTILTVLSLVTISDTVFSQSTTNSKAILDSLEVIKKVGGFVDGYSNPATIEETRLYNITRLFFTLPFIEVKKINK